METASALAASVALAESEVAAARAEREYSARLRGAYKEVWLDWCNTSDALAELMAANDQLLGGPRRQAKHRVFEIAEILERSRVLPTPDPASRPAMEASEPSLEAPELHDAAVHAMTEAAATPAASEAVVAPAVSEAVTVTGREPKPRGAFGSAHWRRKNKNKNKTTSTSC